MELMTELLTSDFRPLDREAADFYLSIVAQVKPDALTLATPCPDWTLYGLLRHQVSQDEGFAAAARGDGARLSAWRSGDLGDDPYAAAETSLELVTRAFAEAPLDAGLTLPEFGDGPVPAALAISAHFVDVVIHAWDVATTIGVPWEPDDELLTACLKVCSMVPTGDDTRGPGLAFARVVSSADDADPKDRLLSLLGRSPSWRP